MILDLFSRKTVAYNVSKKNSTQLITSTFKTAWERRNPASASFFTVAEGPNIPLINLDNCFMGDL